jgi:endonuclease/exonuclease/phosphatase family metal-dependent hydrolase
MNEPQDDPAAGSSSQSESAAPPPRARRRWLKVLPWALLLAWAGLCVWLWSRPAQPQAAGGTSLNQPTAARLAESARFSTIRVASFNIHSGKGRDGRLDLDRTTALLGGFDLIGLNEVRADGIFGTGNQARSLGEKLSMPWLFAPTETRFSRDSWGNGLLCSRPVSRWLRIPLPSSGGRGLRNVTLAHVDVAGVEVAFLITHIDTSVDRRSQLELVSSMFTAIRPPAVLLGDMNTRGNEEPLSALLRQPGVVDAVAAAPQGRQPRIDWIISRGMDVIGAGAEPNDASDHPMVWAELAPSAAVAAPATQPQSRP